MKQLLSLAGGALVLSEAAAVFTLSFDDSLNVGGGQAAGIIAIQGKGSIVLSAAQAEALIAAFAISKSPAAAQPVEELIQDAIVEAEQKL